MFECDSYLFCDSWVMEINKIRVVKHEYDWWALQTLHMSRGSIILKLVWMRTSHRNYEYDSIVITYSLQDINFMVWVMTKEHYGSVCDGTWLCVGSNSCFFFFSIRKDFQFNFKQNSKFISSLKRSKHFTLFSLALGNLKEFFFTLQFQQQFSWSIGNILCNP